MKRAIIHMGMPKTGTTSFQKAIYKNREILLERHRMLYPSIGANHTNSICPMFLPDPRTQITLKMAGISSLDEAKGLVAGFFDEIEREIRSTKWDTLIISAEGLSNLHATSLIDLHRWISKFAESVEIIYWIRHPVSFTVSVMQQLLKGGETIDRMMNEMLPLTNYRCRIENAIAAFGEGAIGLHCFEDAILHENGPVGAFCEQIGVPDHTAQEIVESAFFENESMSMMSAYSIDALNREHPMFINGSLNPNRTARDLVNFLKIRGPRFDLSLERKRKIREISRPEISWLSDKFDREFYPDIMLDGDLDQPSGDIPDHETVESIADIIYKASRSSR